MSDPDESGSDRAVADVLVLGGIVVTMDERRSILSDGALAIRGDSIAALGPRSQIVAASPTTCRCTPGSSSTCGRRSIGSSTPKPSGGGAASASPNYCVPV
jgi:hypothetical protein